MSKIHVRKEVNFNVLKALRILSHCDFPDGITTDHICEQVEYQMLDQIPVPDLRKAVRKSLQELEDAGFVGKEVQSRFWLRQIEVSLPSTSRNVPYRSPRLSVTPRRRRNLKRLQRYTTRKSRKRIRRRMRKPSSDYKSWMEKYFRRKGKRTILPKARQHSLSQRTYRH